MVSIGSTAADHGYRDATGGFSVTERFGNGFANFQSIRLPDVEVLDLGTSRAVGHGHFVVSYGQVIQIGGAGSVAPGVGVGSVAPIYEEIDVSIIGSETGDVGTHAVDDQFGIFSNNFRQNAGTAGGIGNGDRVVPGRNVGEVLRSGAIVPLVEVGFAGSEGRSAAHVDVDGPGAFSKTGNIGNADGRSKRAVQIGDGHVEGSGTVVLVGGYHLIHPCGQIADRRSDNLEAGPDNGQCARSAGSGSRRTSVGLSATRVGYGGRNDDLGGFGQGVARRGGTAVVVGDGHVVAAGGEVQ